MPKLPSYEDVGNVSPNVARDPGINAPLAAFQSGAGVIAGELASGINDVVAVVREEEKRIDNAAGNDARRQLLELETEKDEWLSQQKGENAFTAKAKFDKDIDARSAKIKEGLKNDRQRRLVEEIEADWRVGVNRKASRTIAAEMDNHYDNSDKGLIEASTRASQKSASVGDFDRVQNEWADQEKVLAGLADRKGLSKVERQAMLDARKSDFHVGIVTQLISDEKDILATDYFTSNKSEIDTKAQLALGNQLDIVNTRNESRKQVDYAIKKFNGDERQVLNYLNKLPDTKVADAAASRYKTRISEDAALDSIENDKSFTTALNTIEQSGDFDQIDPVILANISAEDRKTLEMRANQVVAGESPKQNHAKWNEFNRTYDDRMKLASISEREFAKYLFSFDDEHRDRASKLRDAAKKAMAGDKGAKEFLRNDVSLKRLVAAKVVEAGLIPANRKAAELTQEEEAILSEAEARASSELEKLAVSQKSKATVDQEREVVNKLVLENAKAKVKGSGWTDPVFGTTWGEKTKPVREMTSSEKANVKYEYKSVPVSKRDQIKVRAAKIGVDTSGLNEDRIAEAYTAFISAQNKGLPMEDAQAIVDAILKRK